MTVESVTYINTLDETRPAGGDKISEGDNHIRNIKRSLKETYPNVDGEVRATDEEMNFLVGLTEPIKDSLDGGSQDITDIQDELAKKADIKYVDDQDALKADITYVDDELAKKADKTYVDNELAKKADITYVDDQDALKADKSDTYTKADIDVMIAEASSKGGSMIKVVQQPVTAGDFQVEGMEQTYKAIVSVGLQTKKLVVPDGKIFVFEYMYGVSKNGGTLRVNFGDVFIDGVDLYSNAAGSWDFTETSSITWPGNDRGPLIRVEESFEIKNMNCYVADCEIRLAGFFAEA